MSERRPFIRASHYWLWIPAVVILGLAAWVFFGGLNERAFVWINGWSGYTGENYWALLTILSDGLVTFVILLPWIYKKPRIVWAVFLTALLFVMVSEVLKQCVDVSRPPRVLPPELVNVIGPAYRKHSFPSGHAAMIMAAAGVWALHVRYRWLRLVLLFFGSLVAVSRIVVGVHWPLDVLVGAFLGWGMAWPGMMLAKRWTWGCSVGFMRVLGAIILVACVLLFFPYTKFYQIIWEQRTLAAVFLMIGLHEYVKLWRKPEQPEA